MLLKLGLPVFLVSHFRILCGWLDLLFNYLLEIKIVKGMESDEDYFFFLSAVYRNSRAQYIS